MGGFDGGSILATVEAYNPRTNSWRSCLPLSQRRTRAVAGVVGGRLVVAGGFARGVGELASVEAYTSTGWTPLPPLPHAADGATACVLNGRLYVMGGFQCNKLQVLEMSEENEFTWTVKELPAERYSAACVGLDGKLWLMGGKDERAQPTASVFIYEPANDTWAAGPALPHPCSGGSAAVLDGEIHFIGDRRHVVLQDGAWAELADGPARKHTTCQSIPLG